MDAARDVAKRGAVLEEAVLLVVQLEGARRGGGLRGEAGLRIPKTPCTDPEDPSSTRGELQGLSGVATAGGDG